MTYAILLATGLIMGMALTLLVMRLKQKQAKDIAQELVSQANAEKIRDLETVIGRIKDSFGALSMDALSKNNDEFLRLANETLSKQTERGEKNLEGKKALIDQTLGLMKSELTKVEKLVSDFEKDRELKFGALAKSLSTTGSEIEKLRETSSQLKAALSNPQARGQWGERMAEDILKTAGFIEGVNYVKQKQLDSSTSRPDYTFPLPQNLKINMDVKFPLSNYLKYLESDSEVQKESHKKIFLKDVKTRIAEVTDRNYINPKDSTIDCVIVFIPNEQVYAFIHENDPTVLDSALAKKVILCSPFTLYAVLAVIRHSVDSFKIEQTAVKIREQLRTFHNQYNKFVESIELVGKRIEKSLEAFNDLNTTRRNQLERPLNAINQMKLETEFPANDEVPGEFEGKYQR